MVDITFFLPLVSCCPSFLLPLAFHPARQCFEFSTRRLRGSACYHQRTLIMEDSNGIAIDPWVLCRDRYLEDLSEDEKALYENATIENIFYGASAAQKRHEADSKTRLAARKLKPLVAALDQYGKALDVYSNASPTIMCPLWGSVRVVLQVSPPSLIVLLHPTSAVVKLRDGVTDSIHMRNS